jgi:uncharacterized protein YbjT (DUF2867 family)
MRVALFGGTGFIGGYITDRLIKSGHRPSLLIRPGSERKVRRSGECDVVSGDIRDADAVTRTVQGCNAVIYAVGILREDKSKGATFELIHVRGVERVVEAAAVAGIRRLVLISANGADRGLTGYQRTKLRGEDILRASRLSWTILRPSIVYGDPRGMVEFCSLLRDRIIRSPIPAPLFYRGILPVRTGTFAFSPIHVEDLAKTIVRALESDACIGRMFEVGGPDTVDWKHLLGMIARALGKKKLMIPVPAGPVMLAASLLDRFSFFPITRDQFRMLLDGNTCDSRELFALLDISQRSFNMENLAYLGASRGHPGHSPKS